MIILEKGESTLTNASNKSMDVSGRGEITVCARRARITTQDQAIDIKRSWQSRACDWLKDLKNLGILHQDFPKTLPEKRREQVNMQYNSIRGDQWSEQMEIKERMEGREPEEGVQWSQKEEVKEERE